jgi:hypothetical protein
MYDDIEDRIEELDREHRSLKKESDHIKRAYEVWRERKKGEITKRLSEIPEFVREEVQEFVFDPTWKDIDETLFFDMVDPNDVSRKNFLIHREYLRAKQMFNMFSVKDRNKYLKIFNDCLPMYLMCFVQVKQFVNNVEWAREQRNIVEVAKSTYRLATNMMAGTSGRKICEDCSRELNHELEDIRRRSERASSLNAVQKISAEEYHDTSRLFSKDVTLRRALLELY